MILLLDPWHHAFEALSAQFVARITYPCLLVCAGREAGSVLVMHTSKDLADLAIEGWRAANPELDDEPNALHELLPWVAHNTKVCALLERSSWGMDSFLIERTPGLPVREIREKADSLGWDFPQPSTQSR